MDLKQILDSLRTRPYILGKKPRTGHYPSASSVSYIDQNSERKVEGSCMRAEWYDFKGFDEGLVFGPSSPRMARILEMGNKYADMFIKEFKEAGIWAGDEVPFSIPELNLSGRIDAFIKDPSLAPPPPNRPLPEHLIGVEFKTVGGYQGSKGPITSTKDTKLFPKMDNVLQCLVYLYHYGKYGIKKWLLLYIDRALGQSEATPIHWNYHTIEVNSAGHPVISNEQGSTTITEFKVIDVINRFKELQKHVDNNTLPPRDYAIRYDNKKILSLYDRESLNKTQTEAITKIIKKKTREKILQEDTPIIEIGDWRCAYCEYSDICYSNNPELKPTKIIPRPKVEEETILVEDIV